ncbi:MAG: hypothetical protein ACYDH3_05160 [Candidatus Aminicenantales bacterium]
MKSLRVALLAVFLLTGAFALSQETPQTQPPEPQVMVHESKDLGMGAFANSNGPILLAIDTSLASRMLDSPYVMFYAYMAAKDMNQSISVAAKDVVVLYKDRVLTMPKVKEIRANYGGFFRDSDFYRELGKEGINASWIKLYDFPRAPNFYPRLDLRSDLAADYGHMYGIRGFRTPLYFKNPGFAKGDKLVFMVHDVKKPALTGECTVVLN